MASVYCMIFLRLGFLSTYGMEQIPMWVLLHTVFLFWAVVFPFSYRRLKLSGRIRYAHIFCVVLAVVIPLPAALVHLKDGYNSLTTPTLACTGRNADYTYYTYVLPVSIILCVTSCLLVVIIWIIFNVRLSVYSYKKEICGLFSSIGVYLEEITSSKEGEKCWKG